MKSRRLVIAACACFALVLTACGMPNDVKDTSKAIDQRIEKFDGQVTTAQKGYRKLLATSEYRFLNDFSADERREGLFGDARRIAKDAKSVNDTQLKPLIKEDKEERAAEAANLQQNINRLLQRASLAYQGPERRAKAIKAFRPQAAKLLKQDEVAIQAMLDRARQLAGRGDELAKAYPDQRNVVNKSTQPLVSKAAATKSSLKAAGKGNVVAQFDGHTRFKTTEAAQKKELGETSTRLASLDSTVVRTLIDMRTDCAVTVSRTTWDSWDDWETEHGHTYAARQIKDPKGCGYWAEFAEESDDGRFAAEDNTKLNVDDGVDKKQVEKLALDPMEKWDSADDDGEYYIDDIKVRYFHRYREVSNGKVRTYWTQVSAKTFQDNAQNLGMDIYSKPAGVFENQAITQATPPGMAFVGNPKYGEFKKDDNGHSFWDFYGPYLLLSNLMGPGNRIYQSSWNDWDDNYRGRRPYYGGQCNGHPCYGTSSAYATSRFGGSTWGRSGGSIADVRRVGAGVRAGGPGGGGK